MDHFQIKSLDDDTKELRQEINDLKKQLVFEKKQHKHWEELAMIFHDALWQEINKVNLTNVR